MSKRPGCSLGHVPREKWEFDESVAECCADMMSRSVPGYAIMRGIVEDIVANALPEGGTLVELGAGDGEGIAQLVRRRKDAKFVAVENAPAMLKILRGRFAGNGHVRVIDRDLSADDHAVAGCFADVILAVLTMQFVPIPQRRKRIAEAFYAMKPGGKILLVEKVKVRPELAGMFEQLHHQEKQAWGYTPAEIEAKKKSLEGVLVPLTTEDNEWLLRGVGFAVEPFWRDLNFGGWVGEKPR